MKLYSRSPGSRKAAKRFVDENASSLREQLGLAARSPGTVELFDALEPAVATAWLIIEAVSEDLALKKQASATRPPRRVRRDPGDELVVVSQ